MKRIYLEPYILEGKLAVYTIRFEGRDANETDSFIRHCLENGFKEDIQTIKRWIENLQQRGAREEYFRFEGRGRAGPKFPCRLRIYCIRCHDNMIILDGGGVKKGKYAQSGKETKESFDLINQVDAKLVGKIRNGEIFYSFDQMTLKGDLFIDI